MVCYTAKESQKVNDSAKLRLARAVWYAKDLALFLMNLIKDRIVHLSQPITVLIIHFYFVLLVLWHLGVLLTLEKTVPPWDSQFLELIQSSTYFIHKPTSPELIPQLPLCNVLTLQAALYLPWSSVLGTRQLESPLPCLSLHSNHSKVSCPDFPWSVCLLTNPSISLYAPHPIAWQTLLLGSVNIASHRFNGSHLLSYWPHYT